MAKHPPHILELARHGAVLRFRELVYEVDLLLRAFPDLRDAFDADELPVSFIVKRDARSAAVEDARLQRPMSAAARKAASRRTKANWAERRAGLKK